MIRSMAILNPAEIQSSKYSLRQDLKKKENPHEYINNIAPYGEGNNIAPYGRRQ
jgi:hypothetical protein